ncbi:hypothetical protein [Burkholderia vietnamiensis]|uniref:hypothetical protein n=1 Tax=Burkholderia vietnamiensis TaxID=60552 RepID=UPI0018DEC58F|nr:hypothetical protein [Burkholderia vietnamiensis]MBH9642367.1 hypothetical protein [Burkholderia vietnamiensis]
MARHKIKSFNVGITPSGDSVKVEIETELKKPYKFELTPDVNYETVQDIEEKLRAALTHCVNEYERADISVHDERFYVTINVKDFIGTRFTGKRV